MNFSWLQIVPETLQDKTRGAIVVTFGNTRAGIEIPSVTYLTFIATHEQPLGRVPSVVIRKSPAVHKDRQSCSEKCAVGPDWCPITRLLARCSARRQRGHPFSSAGTNWPTIQ